MLERTDPDALDHHHPLLQAADPRHNAAAALPTFAEHVRTPPLLGRPMLDPERILVVAAIGVMLWFLIDTLLSFRRGGLSLSHAAGRGVVLSDDGEAPQEQGAPQQLPAPETEAPGEGAHKKVD
jgi:hypothetical protein